jgi:hypothetical protein
MSDPAEFTDRYKGLMRCYGLESEKTQAGHGNENGDVEQRHHRFKRAMAQELMLRGSVDFLSVDAYKAFPSSDAGAAERRAGSGLHEEMAVMRELPARRMESFKSERVKVDSGSLIYVDRNVYSVPSRLIGEQVEARLFMDHVEVWYGQKKVAEMPRLRGRQKHRVDYRHIIDWLVRKPGAFEHYRYRDELFPTSRFRMLRCCLKEQLGRYQGSKEYLKILELAARDSEVRVDAALLMLLGPGDERRSAPRASIGHAGHRAQHGRFAMSRWQRWTSAQSSISCSRHRRCCNERGPSDQNGVAGEPEGTASAGHARVLRAGRAAGGERDSQLRTVPAAVDAAGVRGSGGASRIAALLRESGLPRRRRWQNFDLKRLPMKADTATEGAGGRQLPGSAGELASVRESWRGQEPLAMRPGP